MSKFTNFKETAQLEAKSKQSKKNINQGSNLKDCDDQTKIFTYTLQRGVGEFVKEKAKNTPLTASGIMNDFIKEEFENYLKTKWNV